MSDLHSTTTLRLVRPFSDTQQITHDAVVAYRRKQQLVMQRETITDLGIFHGHRLSSWMVDPNGKTAVVVCWNCGDAARLDLETTCARLTAGLTQRCTALPATLTPEGTL